MNTSSTLGRGPAGVFQINTDKLQARTRKTLELFISILTARKEAFSVWAEKAGGIQVEFVSGVARNAKAETKLYLEVDGNFQDIEDTKDSLLSLFFPWSKVNPQTRGKIVIALTSGFQGSSLGSQLASLAHEYFVHAVKYQQFLAFIREHPNTHHEVSFYYYYHALEGKDLNGVEQHRQHAGSKEISARKEEVWGNYSGVAEYNAFLPYILEELDGQERVNLTEAAKDDLRSQRRNAAADTAVETPRPPAQVTWKSVEKLKTLPGTIEVLLQHFALIYYQVPDPAPSQSLIAATWQNNHTQGFFPMIYAYQDYNEQRLGDLFGLHGGVMKPLVVTVPQWAYHAGDAVLILPPQPRDIYEAWAEYCAYGGVRADAGNCKKAAVELEHIFSQEENRRINAYIIFRDASHRHMGRIEDVDAWFALKKQRGLVQQ